MEDFRKMFAEAFRLVRLRAPLVHNVTNYVAMAPSANALLAVGASPLMSSAASEMDEISAVSDALVVNIGCIDLGQAEAMRIAAAAACRLGKPWVLDPVGVGLSRLRTDTALELMEEYRPSVIRGNASEVMTLAGVEAGRRGVDSAEDSLAALDSAVELARSCGSVVSVSGPVDCITDGRRIIKIFNGSPLMPKVTAMGCSASSLTAAFAAVRELKLSQPPRSPFQGEDLSPHPWAPYDGGSAPIAPRAPLELAAAAMALMGVAGEIAAANSSGPGSFASAFIDALYRLDPAEAAEMIRYEERTT